MKRLKIAIVVHGRFHAFDLARELINRGHDVTLFTNYPRRIAQRFGVPSERVENYLTHGALDRLTWTLNQKVGTIYPEAFMHRMFGRWAARTVPQEEWDIIHCWSGISEELLRTLSDPPALTVLKRGSSHIRVQNRLLQEEEERSGTNIQRPSSWMIAREEREYDLVDHIAVLSSFAKRSFTDEGVESRDVTTHTLGVNTDAFRPDSTVVQRRCERIRTDESLRVLYVGTLSYRKGVLDALHMAETLSDGNFQFRFVGPVAREFAGEMDALRRVADQVPNQPQSDLPQWYDRSDLFLFPTIEDGFASVLTQAQAAGLPILATANCSAPDILEDGKNGWVLPIRSPEAFVERLRWCNQHRDQLADMVQTIYDTYQPPTWQDAATEFEDVCARALQRRNTPA